MRIDRLTSKLQLALSDAQSLAVGLDHPAIEPAHLMQALQEQRVTLVIVTHDHHVARLMHRQVMVHSGVVEDVREGDL